MATRRVTSADVARAAGVSRTTVSFVLNDTAGQTIPAATRAHVLAVAGELGYAPSAAATSLRRGRSSIVLLLLPDTGGSRNHAFARHLTPAFARHGLTLVTYLRTGRTEEARELWSGAAPAAVLSLDELGADLLSELDRAGVLVTLNLLSGGRTDVPSLEAELGRTQAEHLVAQGHRRLGFAAPAYDVQAALSPGRLAGVREVCRRHGLSEPLVQPISLETGGGLDAVRAWRRGRHPVSAVCAFNDDLALAVLAAAHSLGQRVPEDLAVIGIDDNPIAALTTPPLSTVAYEMEAISEFLAATVSSQLAGTAAPEVPELSRAVRLVARAST